jgi:hypothetical protein
MNSKFEQLISEQMSSITKTKTMRFPRQIQFSEEFMQAIEKEYYTQVISESPEAPVHNRPQKFIKALEFVVADIVKNEETNKGKYRINEDTEHYSATSENSPKQDEGKDVKKTEKNKEEVLKMNSKPLKEGRSKRMSKSQRR